MFCLFTVFYYFPAVFNNLHSSNKTVLNFSFNPIFLKAFRFPSPRSRISNNLFRNFHDPSPTDISLPSVAVEDDPSDYMFENDHIGTSTNDFPDLECEDDPFGHTSSFSQNETANEENV